MKRIRIIKNTIMIGLVIAFAGASVLAMNFIGNSPLGAKPSFSENGGNLQAPPGLSGNSDTPSDMSKQQGQSPNMNDNSQNNNSEGSGFVPDNGNSNNQDSKKQDNSGKSNDNSNSNDNKSNDNSADNKPDDNGQNNGNQNNNLPDNNSGDNNFNRQMPGNNQGGFTPDNNQNHGGFSPDNHRGFGGPHMLTNIIKYGVVAFDSFVIGLLVMYLILSGFNKKGFKDSLGSAKRVLAFIFGTLIITCAAAGTQILAVELVTHLIHA